MPRFFIGADQVSGGRATIVGHDADHLARSLRARSGERVIVVDGAGREHGLLLDEVDPERVTGTLEWTRPATGEPRLKVHMLQAIAKDGMDEAIDAMAEMGAMSIRPCITERTIVRPEPSRSARRVAHWQAIAREAAQLCGRATIPIVHPIVSLVEAVSALPNRAHVLACVVNPTTTALNRIDTASGRPVALCVGPEGDFGPADLATLELAGSESVHMGPRVLRARWAGSHALAILLSRSGDLDEPVTGHPEGGR